MSRIQRARSPAAVSNLSTKPLDSVASTFKKETISEQPLLSTRIGSYNLRRRSKSVGDLTSLTKFGKTVRNTKPSQRPDLKRAATPKAIAVKPKKAITPTWDKTAEFEDLKNEKEEIENQLKQVLNEPKIISLDIDLLKAELAQIKQKELNTSLKVDLLEECITKLKAQLAKMEDQTNEHQMNVGQSSNAKLILENAQLKIDLKAANERIVKLNHILFKKAFELP